MVTELELEAAKVQIASMTQCLHTSKDEESSITHLLPSAVLRPHNIFKGGFSFMPYLVIVS